MKPEIFDLFPLSVFKDKILIQPNEKKKIVKEKFKTVSFFFSLVTLGLVVFRYFYPA